jgi:uncharacterized protein (TIGR03086 family)
MIRPIDPRGAAMPDVKELYRRALERFGRHVHKVGEDQWHGPTPCSEWDVRVLVNHLVSENLWMPPILDGKKVADVGDRFDGDLLGEDPKSAWDQSAKESAAAVRSAPLDTTVHVSYGDVTAHHYISEVMTDLAIHGWDLARAIGDDEAIDPEIVDLLHAELKPKEEELKSTGLFGPRVEAPPGSDKQTQLLALFGRVA